MFSLYDLSGNLLEKFHHINPGDREVHKMKSKLFGSDLTMGLFRIPVNALQVHRAKYGES